MRRKSSLLAFTFVFLLTMRCAAMTASPFPIDLKQPDGTHIRLTIHGNEAGNWFEDKNGYSVLRDDLKRYVYANLDDEGVPGPTSLLVGKADPAKLGLEPGMIRNTPQAQDFGTARGIALPVPDDAANGIVPFDIQPSGTVKNLVILCKFSDHTTTSHTRTREDFDTLFNQAGGHPTIAPTGSVRDYFTEVSYGTMDLQSTVIAWVTLPNPEAYYADGKDGLRGSFPKNSQGMVRDALDRADALVDFGDFDNDNDNDNDSDNNNIIKQHILISFLPPVLNLAVWLTRPNTSLPWYPCTTT